MVQEEPVVLKMNKDLCEQHCPGMAFAAAASFHDCLRQRNKDHLYLRFRDQACACPAVPHPLVLEPVLQLATVHA